MSATIYKRLNVSDTFVVPYTANKSWDIDSGSFADNRIVVNIGVNKSGSIFDPNAEFITNGQYDRLVYNSINLSYYPNFLPTSSHLYLTERQGTVYNDGTLTTQSYYNGFINPGNISTVKFFPTGANNVIYVLNVPKTLTSDKILPTTFEVSFSSGSTYTAKIYDDGNYNLFYSGSTVLSSIGTTLINGSYVGNVFYEQNVAILTIIPDSIRLTGWRGGSYTCSLLGIITYTTLEQYYLDNNASTGITKPNNIGDPDYIAPALNLTLCPLPSASPSATPSVSVTPSISTTPSVTPTVTPSVTPSISVSTSVPSSPSVTPSITPTISISSTPSVTPSITPSVTPSISVGYAPRVIDLNASTKSCFGGGCSDYLGWDITLLEPVLVNTNYILNIELYLNGVFSNIYTAYGTIPAGQTFNSSDPCLGGGAYVGCGYTVNSVCVAAIGAPVNPSTFDC
jgi:hypothetical protein